MAIIPLQTARRVSISTPEPLTTQPSRNAVDPVAAAVGSIATDASRLTEVLAQKEMEQLDTLYKSQLAADTADFHLESIARLGELQTQGTGDKPFVQGVMDDFKERSQKIVGAYPPAYQEALQTKMLSTQQQVAGAAIKYQQDQINRQILTNAETVANDLQSRVRWGMATYEQAESERLTLLQDTPEGLRDKVEEPSRQRLLLARMEREMLEDPRKFLAEIPNYVEMRADSRVLTSMAEKARTLANRLDEVEETRVRKINDLFRTDPAQAAIELAGRNLTPGELREIQIANRVHPADVAIITKAEAEKFVKDLSQASTIEQGAAILGEQKARLGEDGEDFGQFMENIDRFKLDLHPAARMFIDYSDHVDKYPIEVGEKMLFLARDPDAGKRAKSNLRAKGVTDTEVGALIRQVTTAFANDERIALAAGAEPVDIEREREARIDVALLLADQYRGKDGKLDANKVVKAMAPKEPLYDYRIENAGAYAVPLQDGKTDYSPEFMEAIRMSWVEREDLEVAKRYPTENFGRQDIKNRAAWVNDGRGGVKLVVNGSQVYAGGKPIKETWKDLSFDVPAWREHLRSNTDARVAAMRRARGMNYTPVAPFKRAERPVTKAIPTVAPREEGVLHPPPVNQKPSTGGIQLPGMLPPPNLEDIR